VRRIPTDTPLWTYVLLAINLLIFILMEASGGTLRASTLVRFGANYAPLVANGEVFRLVTANFIHIGVMHFLLNALSLYNIGPLTESLFGKPRFIMLYLLSGISGATLSYFLTHGLSAGASTALAGMTGALFVYFFRHRNEMRDVARQYMIRILMIVAINVAYGLSPGSGVDNWGHLGGLLGGAALGWFFCPRYEVSQHAFGVVNPRKPRHEPELDNGSLMDTNTIAGNWLTVLIFVAVIAALVFLRGRIG